MSHKASLSSLLVLAGPGARKLLADNGWCPDLFRTLIGASGGPKWFILSRLDQRIFGDFLLQRSQPLTAIGSSVGAWRHACLAQPDPAAAVRRLEYAYLNQHYSTDKPTVDEITDVSRGILDHVLGETGAVAITEHVLLRTHIVTARGRGLTARAGGKGLTAGMVGAFAANTVKREALQACFQRVVFSTASSPELAALLPGFDTVGVPLRAENTAAALMATGSIPYVLAGERDITGAPRGHYWDGGIIDYHFALPSSLGEGLVLYPHFSPRVIPGWFDKFLPWRDRGIQQLDNMVFLCPHPNFIRLLPFQKIPDRRDFTRLAPQARKTYWQQCIDAGGALAADFGRIQSHSDPLHFVEHLEKWAPR